MYASCFCCAWRDRAAWNADKGWTQGHHVTGMVPTSLILPVGMLDADFLHAASHEASWQAVDCLKDIHMRSGWGQAMSFQHVRAEKLGSRIAQWIPGPTRSWQVSGNICAPGCLAEGPWLHAGSVRVPASYCGIPGHRPTWGRVSMDSTCPLAPSYDTGAA